MIKKLIIALIFCLCIISTVKAQSDCRDFTPTEQALYTRLLRLFDEHIKDKCSTDDWAITLKSTRDENGAVGQKMIPERPFCTCGTTRLCMDVLFPWYTRLSDSSKAIDEQKNTLVTQVMNTSTDGIDSKALERKLAPLQKQIHDLAYKQMELSSRYGAQLTTDINLPLLMICTHAGGSVPFACKRINIPGVAVAYLLSFHDADAGNHSEVVLGLGHWVDNIKKFDFNDDITIGYHFVHHYSTPVIENLAFRINSGRIEDVMSVVHKIEWEPLNQILTQ